MRSVARHPGEPKLELDAYSASDDALRIVEYDDRYGEPESVEYDDGYDLDAADNLYDEDGQNYYDHDYYDQNGDQIYEGEQTETFVVSPATRALEALSPLVHRVEESAVRWMARWSIVLAQLCLGLIYLWFGALKFFPDLSPAEALVRATVSDISAISGIPLPVTPTLFLLATWEVAIGIGLLLDHYRRAAIWMLVVHLPTTMLPFVLLPELVWTQAPIGLTLEGQYIVKNLALLASASAVGAALHSRDRASRNPDVAVPASTPSDARPKGRTDRTEDHLRRSPSRTADRPNETRPFAQPPADEFVGRFPNQSRRSELGDLAHRLAVYCGIRG